jgi:gamma-glutamylcysteine synthetase
VTDEQSVSHDAEIASLLEQSRGHHEAAKTCRQQKDAVGNRERLTQARTLRQQAHDLDPLHESQAWQEPKTYRHHALMAWYAQQLDPKEQP